MCGRYSVTHTAAAIAERFEVETIAGFEPRYNAAPSQHLPVVRRADGAGRKVDCLRWGLIPFWAKEKKIGYRMINARSETAATKPSFRNAFKSRRCLVVADGFYEWVKRDGEKWPMRVTFGGGELGAFAGLWERWTDENGEETETYTILTADAAPTLQHLHDRMPVWAPEEYWDSWLFDDEHARENLATMVDAFPQDAVDYYGVSRELNRPQNDRPELIEPLEG